MTITQLPLLLRNMNLYSVNSFYLCLLNDSKGEKDKVRDKALMINTFTNCNIFVSFGSINQTLTLSVLLLSQVLFNNNNL